MHTINKPTLHMSIHTRAYTAVCTHTILITTNLSSVSLYCSQFDDPSPTIPWLSQYKQQWDLPHGYQEYKLLYRHEGLRTPVI